MEIRDFRKPRQRYSEFISDFKQFPYFRAVQVLARQDQALRPFAPAFESLDNIGKLIRGAHNGDAANISPDPATLLIDDTNHAVSGACLVIGRAYEHLRAFASSDQKNGYAPMMVSFQQVIELTILGQPIEKTRSSKKCHKHKPVNQEERARQCLKACYHEHEWCKNQDYKRYGTCDCNEIVKRCITPDATIKSHRQKYTGRNDSEDCRSFKQEVLGIFE